MNVLYNELQYGDYLLFYMTYDSNRHPFKEEYDMATTFTFIKDNFTLYEYT